MVHMVGQQAQRRVGVVAAVRAQEAHREVEPDQAAGLADRGELAVGQVARAGAKACALEWLATSGASLKAATSQNPASLRWLRSIMIRSSLQARTSALPASVRPGPVSGELGKRNGTPCPNALGRLQTGPQGTQPRRVQDLEPLQLGVDRLPHLDVEHGGERALVEAAADVGGAAADDYGTSRVAGEALEAGGKRQGDRARPLEAGRAGNGTA